MEKMESFTFMAALISLGLSSLFYLLQTVAVKKLQPALIGGASVVAGGAPRIWDFGRFATVMNVNGLVFLLFSIMTRWSVTGHGPFSSMYEFSIAFAWGIVGASLYFQWRYRSTVVSTLVIPLAVGFLIYAYFLPSRPTPLVPALQQSLLLTLHVAVAMIAYGFMAVGFGAAALYLVQRGELSWLPNREILDDMAYRAVIIGFPFLTLTLVLGALWADIAWGRYWGWDPKETATLLTWLLYGGYLHSRAVRGWKGNRSAVLIVFGFAAVMFTYFGNYIFSGLHAYG